MDFDTLKTFVAIADHGSLSAAAQALYLTQPAVSKRLAALESTLELRLFDRIGKQARLTQAGSTLLPHTRELLMQAQSLKNMASNLKQEVSGPLLLGTSHHIGLHRLPKVLKIFRRSYPQVDLDIRFMDSEAACHAVQIGELELAIVTLPDPPGNKLKLKKIWDDPLCFVCAPDHELAQRDAVTLQELTCYPAVLPGATTYTRAILERALRKQGLAITLGMATNYLETIKMLTDINLGWSLLPASMIRNSSLHQLPLTLQLHRRLGTVSHENRTLSNPARALLRTLEQAS